MTSIQEQIANLTDIITNRIDEVSIVSDGDAILESLRDAWRADRKQFTENDLGALQRISRQLDALKEFLLEQEDFPDLAMVEDADEVIIRLYSLVVHLDGLAVTSRVKKGPRHDPAYPRSAIV